MRDETREQKPPFAHGFPDHQWGVEYNVLGCLMLEKGFYEHVAGRLKLEYFQIPIHQRVFAEIERRFTVGLPTDFRSLQQSLPNELVADNIYLHDYLRKTGSFSSNAADLGVKQIETLRLGYMLAAAESTGRHLRTPGGPDEALETFFSAVDDVRADYQGAQRTADTKSIGASAAAFVNGLSERIKQENAQYRVRCGINGIDNMLDGFGPGDLIIIAGRPGMGKTTMLTSIIRGAALVGPEVDLEGKKQRKRAFPALFFSFEMTEDQIMARMMAEDIAYNTSDLSHRIEYRTLINPASWSYEKWSRRNGFSHSPWEYIKDAEERFKSMPIELDCSASMTLGELAARARRVKKNRQDLSLIGIDYLKYIKASDRYMGNRVLEVGEITGGLKRLAKELSVPIILLCQLNRAVENRKEKEPTLSDLRESGEIEQDADVVMFTYRRSYYNRTSAAANDMEVIVEKNRNGPTGKVELWVDLGRSMITDRQS